MPTWVILLVFSIGAALFLYGKLSHSNGNANPKGNIIAASAIGVLLFLVTWSLTNMLF